MLYTYWLFYLKEDNSLYAYTDTKKLAKRFKKERNMNKFICEKSELSKEDVRRITEDYEEDLLIERDLATRNNNKVTSVSLVITKREDYTVMMYGGDLVASDIFIQAWTNPKVFNKTIRKALKIIGYIDCFKYTEDGREMSIFDSDDLGIFLRHYKDTMNTLIT